MESKINFYITIVLEIELLFISLFHKITMFVCFVGLNIQRVFCHSLISSLFQPTDVGGVSKYQEQQAGDTTHAVSHTRIAFSRDRASFV